MDRPTPLTPADCNLQDFAFMPLDVQRLLKSETWVLASGEEKAAAMCLWLESWHQIPAASIPGNDKMLAHLSQSPKWSKVKAQAMRGWVQCSDDRFYHPVVAEKALEAWIEKLLNVISGASGNAKRWSIAINTDVAKTSLGTAIAMLQSIAPASRSLKKKAVLSVLSPSPPDSPPDSGKSSPPDSGEDRNRQGQGQGQGSYSVPNGTGADAPKVTDPNEIIFGYGLPMLTNAGTAEKQARSFLGGLRKAHGDSALIDKLRECIKAKPLQPLEWLAAALPPVGHDQKQKFGAAPAKYAAAAAAIFDDEPAANTPSMKHMGEVINA